MAVVVLVPVLTACASDPPTDDPASSRPRPVVATAGSTVPPVPPGSAMAAVEAGATGDLRLAFGGDCVVQTDRANALWLKLTFSANWIGGAFPTTAYSVSSDVDGRSTAGEVTSPDPFVARIGGEPAGGNAFLGRTVVVTVTIDPEDAVAEISEGNNVIRVSVTVPATAPADGADQAVPCE